MTAEEIPHGPASTRRPWLAGFLAAVCPGLGHLYVGRPLAALILLIAGPGPLFVGLVLLGTFNVEHLLGFVYLGIALALMLWVFQLTWAVLAARREGAGYRLRWFNRAWLYFGVYAVSSFGSNVLGSLFRENVLEPFLISGLSMLPTLSPGDHVFLLKSGQGSAWGRGDVVVYRRADALPLIQRVMAKGGDSVEVDDRQVTVNGLQYAQRSCADEPVSLSCREEQLAERTPIEFASSLASTECARCSVRSRSMRRSFS
ncbi:MAG: signal peptidase I [Archangium sp.]|nr:signal peptidase I [Archangium sp.]